MKGSSRLYGEILELFGQEVQPDSIILDLAAGTGLLALEKLFGAAEGTHILCTGIGDTSVFHYKASRERASQV